MVVENWGVREWLNWQESTNPNAIDLSLDRVRVVLPKLAKIEKHVVITHPFMP